MTTAVKRTGRRLYDSLDLGEFSLILPDESVQSGAGRAAEIRASIADAFAKLDPMLSLLYDLEIEETEVHSGSRKSKNKPRLKRKKGRTILQKLMAIGSALGFAVGVLSADYSKIPENLEKACQVVVADCKLRGKNIEITDKHFPPVDPRDA